MCPDCFFPYSANHSANLHMVVIYCVFCLWLSGAVSDPCGGVSLCSLLLLCWFHSSCVFSTPRTLGIPCKPADEKDPIVSSPTQPFDLFYDLCQWWLPPSRFVSDALELIVHGFMEPDIIPTQKKAQTSSGEPLTNPDVPDTKLLRT